jgi:hypothetical protein
LERLVELHALVEEVRDEKSFLVFVDALRRDRELAAAGEKASPSGIFGPSQRGWENITIESFLEAAYAWAEDTEFGATQDLREASPWKKFAVFLYCGKIYE